MRIPAAIRKSASVYHVNTTTGSYPGSADATVEVGFLPLDRQQHALEGGDLSAGYECYAASSADLRVGDKLTIDAVTYYIKHVFNAPFGTLSHKRLSLSTEP